MEDIVSNYEAYLVISVKTFNLAGCWWLTLAILATQKVEIRRILVRSQPSQIVHDTLSQKNPSQKRTGGMAQAVRAPA
jgi:hypothetical protein